MYVDYTTLLVNTISVTQTFAKVRVQDFEFSVTGKVKTFRLYSERRNFTTHIWGNHFIVVATMASLWQQLWQT